MEVYLCKSCQVLDWPTRSMIDDSYHNVFKSILLNRKTYFAFHAVLTSKQYL